MPVLRANNLLGYITAVFKLLQTKHKNFPKTEEEPINIVFGGDKGGSLTKFHFEIVATELPLSAYGVKIFVMYKAADTASNMLKVISPFESALQELQKLQITDFRLDGRRVNVFLNGDFKFLDLC